MVIICGFLVWGNISFKLKDVKGVIRHRSRATNPLYVGWYCLNSLRSEPSFYEFDQSCSSIKFFAFNFHESQGASNSNHLIPCNYEIFYDSRSPILSRKTFSLSTVSFYSVNVARVALFIWYVSLLRATLTTCSLA